MTDGFLGRLEAILGRDHLLVDPALRAGYETDWTRRYSGSALAVVRPGSAAEVSAVVVACASAGVAVVPQGGNTGTVGAGVPRGGEVLLSLRRLDRVEQIDVDASQVTAGAGATLASVQAAARRAGLDVGVDLPARDAATIGGMIATNAGGTGVFRYGSMRRQVLGVEAVLADGSVIERLSGLVKDNTGYDLAGLIAGSEGTLAVVTRARLRLVPALPERAAALFALPDLDAALAIGRGLVADLPGIVAVEFMSRPGVEVAMAHFGIAEPGPPGPWYLLVECAGRAPVADDLVAALEPWTDHDPAMALDAEARAGLWRFRDGLPEALNAETVPIKMDVSVPLGSLERFCATCPAAVARVLPSARTVLFGHLLDGNVHVNVNDPATDPSSDDALTIRIEEAVVDLVLALDGSISAEHGVGVAKTRFLAGARSAADLAAMRRIKDALDPAGILNPGVLFDRDA